ncbi:hypothetical protein QBC33DRAFT_612101 [Phialemonium atrogriseum]|uniref:Uncharacterized protein n=1 Tax=Phialemonium atrogriseum TaxID=1093897 RepID=A0AAJ0FEV4_9PEZI|nr:uncharacterized protein QBC33DRAFT_612101 [Phialemonium atrogriseum]KAK1765971.1 hypothetical protein QBC33DRAFT_612101 [Phialemonium atrogriseum]
MKTNTAVLLGWSWEILAITVSLGCMTSIVTILVKMKDHPLSEWTFSLSLPATISISSTAAKSTAGFGVAACISQYKWLYFKMAARTLGDFDLFEEASRGPVGSLRLLATRPRELASIGARGYYTRFGFTPFTVAVDDGRASFGLAHRYRASARSIDGVGVNFQVEASTADKSMQGAIYRGFACADVTNATLLGISPSLWNGLGSASLLSAVYPGRGSDPNPNDLIQHGALIPANIARITVLRVPSDWTSWFIQYSKMEIVECKVSLAAYSYSGISASGSNLTIAKQELIPLNPGVATWNLSDTAPTPSLDIVFNQSGLSVLKASVQDVSALNLLFVSDRFNGSIYDGEEPPSPPQGVADVFRSGDISQTFQNMARSMTDQLRSSYNVTARGLSMDQVVFVQVRWEWLILPAVVQVSSVLFVFLIVVRSRRTRELQLWKLSTVAFLFHGVMHQDDVDGARILGTSTKARLK